MKALILTLFLCGCAYPSFDDKDVLTRNPFDQPWPGYEVPDYVILRDRDTRQICGSVLDCVAYAKGTCLIVLSPVADYNVEDHAKVHCILRHNGEDSSIADKFFPVRY